MDKKCRLLVCFLVMLLVFCCATAMATPYQNTRQSFATVAGEKEKIILSFVGDCTIGCTPQQKRKENSILSYIDTHGYAYPFNKVQAILAQDDITVANLESVFYEGTKGKAKNKFYHFSAPSSYSEVLQQGSVELVSLGNNHAYDYGKVGFASTVKTLDEAQIPWFAECAFTHSPYVYTVRGIKIGFIGLYEPHYWQYGEEIRASFAELKKQGVALTVVYMHAGAEYSPRHGESQTYLAQRMIANGADIVVGAHPHRLQGYQVLDKVPIFYSLGNFVFGGNEKIREKYSVILQLALSFDDNNTYMGYQFNVIPCRLSEHEKENRYQPYPIVGREAQEAIAEMQRDTEKSAPLADYKEGVGAVQPYVPVLY